MWSPGWAAPAGAFPGGSGVTCVSSARRVEQEEYQEGPDTAGQPPGLPPPPQLPAPSSAPRNPSLIKFLLSPAFSPREPADRSQGQPLSSHIQMLLHQSPGDLAFGEVPGDGSASCFAPSGRGLVAPERPPAPAPLRSAHCTQQAPCPAARLQEAQRASFLTGTLPAQLPDCLLQPDATPGRWSPPLPHPPPPAAPPSPA